MTSAATVRFQIEAALANRIPSALSMVQRTVRPSTPTGIASVDNLLKGLPIGAITEITGPECSGRTSFTLTFLARLTQAERAVAWIDATNALQPECAAAAGVELSRMLWVRCGVAAKDQIPNDTPQPGFELQQAYFVPPPIKQGLHGGGCGGHPRSEVKGMSTAIAGLLCPLPATVAKPKNVLPAVRSNPVFKAAGNLSTASNPKKTSTHGHQFQLDQALRVADLLLQGGGFSAIVLDLASIAPELGSRVPLATWFRYRAASERTQTSFLLLTQQACARSSAELVLNFQPSQISESQTLRDSEQTVFTGIEHRMDVLRQRFNQPATNVIPMRKPPRNASVSSASWQSRAAWAGRE